METDMIIAVTRNDETNMVVCQLASSLFNISKKIARIRTKDFLEGKWRKLYNKSNIPIDVIISPEIEVAKSLQRKSLLKCVDEQRLTSCCLESISPLRVP